MREKTIVFRDPTVESVVDKFVERSDVGFKKYGTTMRNDPSDLFVWLNHLQEELMDATLYIQRLKEEVTNLREEESLMNDLEIMEVVDAFVERGYPYSITIDEED
jgi:hypothetical protein